MDGFIAFLSYSHKDDEVVSWFHRNLERWKIDRDLVGRETVHGVIPASLSPVFRDRDDFAGGHSLVDATLGALRSSEFLIVFCSPNSAKSEYVNEEVRLFKAMGSPEKVIPVIIAGEPGDPDDECFPPAVKYQVSPDGEILDAIEQPIAPDAREAGDGRKRALAKLVAGILGLSFDEIIRREMRQRRNRNAVLAGSAIGAFVFATAFGSYALYRNYQASITINKSVFAIGGLIQEADKMEGEEMEVSRTEMLRSLCDLIDGLSRDPEDIGKIERSICLCERALARSGSESTTAAHLVIGLKLPKPLALHRLTVT